MNIRSILRWDSIITRILLIIILLTTFIGGVSALLGYFYLQSNISGQIEDKVSSLIETIEPSAEVGLYIQDTHLLKEVVEGLLKNPEFLHVTIYDTQNQLIAGSVLLSQEKNGYRSSERIRIKPIYSPFNPEEKTGEIHFSYNRQYINQQVVDVVSKISLPMLLQPLIITLTLIGYLSVIIVPRVRHFLNALNQVDINRKELLPSEQFSKDLEVKKLVQHHNALLTKFYELIDRERVLRDQLARERQEIRQLNQDLEHKVEQRTQELLMAKNAAEAANRVKSDFLASMSHELRTPLNAIIGFAQFMEMDDITEDQAECLQQIQQSGEYLLSMVNDILDFAQIEAQGLTINTETSSLIDSIKHCCETIQILAEKRRITLEYQCAETLMVTADTHRLRQVMLNLLSNAVKYNHDQGRIKVDCQPCDKDRIRISVTDTGIGIPPDQTGSLFTPFARLGQENSNTPGTGLGLSIAQHLIKAMKGKMGYRSQPGSGSTFWIELPV